MDNPLNVSKKVVVYTAIFGGKDQAPKLINKQAINGLEVDLVCFTDDVLLTSDDYEIRLVDRQYADVTKNARSIKINGFPGVKNYSTAIWHDSSVTLNGKKIQDLVSYVDSSPLATFSHADNCIYAEARSCIKNHKDHPLRIAWQSLYYGLYLKYPLRHGLYETTIIVYGENYFDSEISNRWWKQLERFSRRDQLALPVVLWQTNKQPAIIPGKGFDNDFSEYIGHRFYHYDSSLLIHKFNGRILDKIGIWIIFRLEKHLTKLKRNT